MFLFGILHQTFLVVFAFFVLERVESQTITVYPPNVGVQRGEQNVALSCNVTGLPPNSYIEWHYFPTWRPTGFLIYSSFNGGSYYDQANFTVFHTTLVGGIESIDLVIKTAMPELATQYICRVLPNSEQSIYVVVLDPLECPVDIVEFDEGIEANMSCSVNFFESMETFAPMITWTRDGVEVPGVVKISESTTRKTARLVKNVTSGDDDQEFVCVVDFIDSNPDYTDNCSTIFYVKHFVSEVSFYPPSSAEAPIDVAVGDTINCTTNGRPAPTITWFDSSGNVLSEGSDLIVTEDMRSWEQPITLYCRANNSLDNGVTFSGVEGNYTCNVVEGAPMVQTGGVEAWVIAVAVIVPIVVIAAIAIAVFFIIRHRKKKKKAKAKTTNGSASARPTTTTTTTTYAPVPGSDFTNNVSRPPPTSAPRTTGSISSNLGPPGPDNRTGAGYSQNPGFGDLGVQTYGGSNQAVNAYPPARSLHGSNQALGVGVSMNPNPGYPVRSTNQALNTSVTTNPRPSYPYTGSNSALNTSISLSPNPIAAPGASYGRQPSIASSSGRSHASSYNAAIPAVGLNRYPNDLSSMHGSEV